jgi:hypothetical protein
MVTFELRRKEEKRKREKKGQDTGHVAQWITRGGGSSRRGGP